ncbi:oxidative stress-induced growth inhibitor 1-like isoform X2 [Ornithodoros turicata]|uniref:oxidative stress-induced growth inhibitor 1-like isoform X2 n=1 Tax=Ornithodoros turicata TaxID=34597 RepID=UPI0031395C9F
MLTMSALGFFQNGIAMAEYKDVVVVGNGPSGITMSFLLAGNWPYYTASSHPNTYLHARLDEKRDVSLVELDLEELSCGLEGRSNNPVSLLLDALIHPDADLGSDEKPALSWSQEASKALDHVVIGVGPPGGSWQRMDGSILTISLGSWMELPDLTFREWEQTKPRTTPCCGTNGHNRAPVQRVAQYYRDYVSHKGLTPYFRSFSCVTSIRITDEKEGLWEVAGYDTETGVTFQYITHHVVLAVGQYDEPKLLDVAGEDLSFVFHDLSHLEDLLRYPQVPIQRLAVVGSGLSAADAVIAARFHGVDVAHIFRKKVDDPALIFNQLPRNMYPEYHKVHQMMGAAENYPGYKAYSNCQVKAIKEDGTVVLDSGVELKDISHMLVLIGSYANLNFLSNQGLDLGLCPGSLVDCRANPIEIHPFTHETLAYKGLYALGPLVGDNFVRFLQGGALAVTSHVWRSYRARHKSCQGRSVCSLDC